MQHESHQARSGATAYLRDGRFRSLVVLLSFVFTFRWSVAAPYVVPTPSMEPSIKVGDRLLGNHLAYGLKVPFTSVSVARWAEPGVGDIVIFDSRTEPGVNLVKRVIAKGGDEVAFRDGVLYVNDIPQELMPHDDDRSVMTDMTDRKNEKSLFRENLSGKEHWVVHNRAWGRHSRAANWPPEEVAYVVPPEHVFVAGDNRDNSSDSRAWGPVPVSSIHGRASRILWSAYFGEGSWQPKVRLARFGMKLE